MAPNKPRKHLSARSQPRPKAAARRTAATPEQSAQIQQTVLDGDVLLSTADLAAVVRRPVSWVWNQPPARLPIQTRISGRAIFYRKSDVRAWLESRRVDLTPRGPRPVQIASKAASA